MQLPRPLPSTPGRGVGEGGGGSVALHGSTPERRPGLQRRSRAWPQARGQPDGRGAARRQERVHVYEYEYVYVYVYAN